MRSFEGCMKSILRGGDVSYIEGMEGGSKKKVEDEFGG
jgi:hypothetical protein